MVPMLPCGDIDEMAAFWTALGLKVTYRQRRPNPYLALGRNAIDLHYYGMADVDPEQSHSTCAIVVSDTALVMSPSLAVAARRGQPRDLHTASTVEPAGPGPFLTLPVPWW